MAGPLEVVPEVRERPPPIFKMSMVGPLGGEAGDPGAPTTYLKGIDGAPLGGDAGDPGAPITYPEDVDGGLPWR
jgi:hypothetical protein